MNIRTKQQLKAMVMRDKLWSVGILKDENSKMILFPKSYKERLIEQYGDKFSDLLEETNDER